MSIITLTTDFGLKDFSVASVKGAILKELAQVTIVDVSHQISPFNIGEAAYIIKNVYQDFPEESIHIIGVDALPNENKKLLVAKIANHYFICADNGILSLILSESQPEEIVEITINKYKPYSNSPTRDIFVPVACHLCRGGSLNVIGAPTNSYRELNLLRAQVKEDKSIIGTVIYIDNFGNAITNISYRLFNECRRGRDFQIIVRNLTFEKLANRYSDVVKDFTKEVEYHGDGIALFNSNDFLEIAIYKPNLQSYGGASSLMGLSIGTHVTVKFI